MRIQNPTTSQTPSALIHRLGMLALFAGCSSLTTAAEKTQEAADTSSKDGFEWQSEIPADCPFPRSPTLTGVHFTGRHSDYRCGDTFYPSWASDGNLYSPWTDGTTDGVKCYSGDLPKRGAVTGHAVMIGDDPLKLEIKNTSPPKEAWAKPYRGRYPGGSLVHNGIWYYGTYCLGPKPTYKHNGLPQGLWRTGVFSEFSDEIHQSRWSKSVVVLLRQFQFRLERTGFEVQSARGPLWLVPSRNKTVRTKQRQAKVKP